MQSSWEPDFFVGDWWVRPALGKLERGDESVALEPRSMQFLCCLASHAPDLVSKPRLIREIWGEGVAVTDEVLSHAVWELRKAFGDEARNPRYIATLPRKGYRLVAKVSSVEPIKRGSRIGQYEIVELVAGGAMGEVYKAKDQRLDRTVALKFLPADLSRDLNARRRFLREAKAVAQLDHPNVATIYDAGETQGQAFLALAFYGGETLQQKLESGPLPVPEAVDIARQIAKGLGAAHHRKIVHRDIKPANVMLLPDGTLKIVDFGLAAMPEATALTRLGFSPGTPTYKSPEQTRGGEPDPRSDLWALGVVLYQMVTGHVPFGGDYPEAVIYAILNEPMRPLDDSVPANLAAVIQKALEKDVDARYQTAEEMEADLAAVSVGRDVVQSKPTNDRSEVRRKPDVLVLTIGKKRLRIVLSVLAVLILATGSWYLWHLREQRKEYQRAHRWDFSPEVKKYVDQGDQLEWRGDTERILGNAVKVYRNALESEPKNPVVMAYLAALLARIQAQFPDKERLAEINLLTEQAVKLAPDHSMPWVAKAKLLLLERKPEEAESAAREAIEQDPEFDRGYTVLGEALIRQGDQKGGLAEIKRGTEVGEEHLRARLEYGIQLKNAGEYPEASIELGKVLNLDPGHPTALHYLGEVYRETGQEADALPLLREAAEAGEWRSANSLGNLYLKMGQDEKAVEYFTDVYQVQHEPTVARNLAEANEKLGKDNEADRWYETALKGFNDRLGGSRTDAHALKGRSFCLAKLDRFKEAFADIHDAMKLKPNENSFLFRAAQVYFLAGSREEAFSYLQRAIQAGLPRDEIVNDFVFKPHLNDPKLREILEGN